jgi:hypothetical protein
MMTKSLINMERSYGFYAGGIGLILVLSLVVSNVPELAFSSFWDFPYRRKISACLFLAGATMGAWAVHKHMHRTKTPWSVAQSQVSLPYLAFIVCSLLALILSR